MGPSETASSVEVVAPLAGTCVQSVAPGTVVAAGGAVVVVESMKTEHVVAAPADLEVVEVLVGRGDAVAAGAVVARGRLVAAVADGPVVDVAPAPQGVDRPDLAEVLRRRALLSDAARPAAVARRAERGRRTARSNVEDLLDPGSFDELGGLAIAAQRGRRSTEELIERTPADGLLTGTGTVDGTAVAVLAYDASVLAGTQGFQNHRKTDRLVDLAGRHDLPLVLYAEGGGGRPGDVDAPGASVLDVPTFARFAALAARVPTVAVVAGYCFAGNAALAGCCDVIVATEDSNLGMAGPAMIEGGGLGRVAPTDIGPIDVGWGNGTVDVRVADEAAATAVARELIGLATRPVADAPAPADQTALRDLVPLERRRAPDLRRVLATLADPGSVRELRGGWAPGMVTALARIGGHAVGVLANDPTHLGGAIDADAARSATRLVELCTRWELPVLALCDTPGFMVGPDAEAEGQVRAFGDLFLAAARHRGPWVFVAVRRAYGLGAQAMAGGGLHEPELSLAWPTGELGGMGLEGAVRLGFATELAAIEDPDERARREAWLIERAHEHADALHVATHGELDDVIDPADTRGRVLAVLSRAGLRRSR